MSATASESRSAAGAASTAAAWTTLRAIGSRVRQALQDRLAEMPGDADLLQPPTRSNAAPLKQLLASLEQPEDFFDGERKAVRELLDSLGPSVLAGSKRRSAPATGFRPPRVGERRAGYE